MLKKSQVHRQSNLELNSDGWRPPGGYEECNRWALENRLALEQYAQRNEKNGTAAEQLQHFLAQHPELLNDDHAAL